MSQDALKVAATSSRERTILDLLQEPRVQAGLAAVGGKYLKPDRMLRLMVNAVKKTPKLLQCDTSSLLGAMMTTSALELEPNTVLQQAYLIPYERSVKDGQGWKKIVEATFQIGYRGWITLAYRLPNMRLVQSEAIHRGDLWSDQMGSESFCRYSKTLSERGPLIGAFCYTRFAEGIEASTVLPLEEIQKIRGRSETYRALTAKVANAQNEKDRQYAAKQLAETPWVMWEDDMAAKSAVKKHCKKLPASIAQLLAVASEVEDLSESGVLDLSAMVDPDQVRAVVSGTDEAPQLEDQSGSDAPPSTLGKDAAKAGTQRQDVQPTPAAKAPATVSME